MSDDSSPGILYASGLIAGGSIAGIGLALLFVYENLGSALDLSKHFPDFAASNWTAVIMFTLLMIALFRVGSRKEKA